MTQTKFRKSMAWKLLKAFLCVWVLLLCAGTGGSQDLILNPVGPWIPVVTEFLLAGGNVSSVGDPGPPFEIISSRFPSIPSAWDVLKEMAAIKDRAYYASEHVLSGWRPWTSPDPKNKGRLLSGIEAKSSEHQTLTPAPGLPVLGLEVGMKVPITFKVEIWGRHRLTGKDERQYFPGDAEYQKYMKEKIQVTDFSLTVHKLEGDFGYQHIRNRAQPEAYMVIAKHRGGWDNSLASYEAQAYTLVIKDAYLAELQLEMRLRFPESEKLQASAYDVPVRICLRFISGTKKSFRKISDEIRKK